MTLRHCCSSHSPALHPLQLKSQTQVLSLYETEENRGVWAFQISLKNEIRDSDVGAGESGRYNGERRRGTVTCSVQRGRGSSAHRPNWVGLTHSVPIRGAVLLLPTRRLPGDASQPCPCHCSRRFSLGRRHLSRCHFLHLLPGSLIFHPYNTNFSSCSCLVKFASFPNFLFFALSFSFMQIHNCSISFSLLIVLLNIHRH